MLCNTKMHISFVSKTNLSLSLSQNTPSTLVEMHFQTDTEYDLIVVGRDWEMSRALSPTPHDALFNKTIVSGLRADCKARRLWFAGALLVMTMMSSRVRSTTLDSTLGDKWFCGEQRAAEFTSGLSTLSPCGNMCPPNVKSKATIAALKDCPIDGWLVYATASLADTAYVRRLKETNTSKIPLPGKHGTCFRWSPDGEWVGYGSQYAATLSKIWIFKRDGSFHKPLMVTANDTLKAVQFNWYRQSPYEDPPKKIYEIAWHTTTDAYAQRIDLSGQEPRLLGEKRTIAAKIAANTGGFAVGKDVLLWDEQVPQCPIVGYMSGCDTKPEPMVLYTIPDGGRGVSDNLHKYRVWGPFNCGTEMSWDGQCVVANEGRYNSDCLPNGHYGFGVLKVKRYNDPRCTVREWWIEEGHGSVSVNFVPEKVESASMWISKSDWGDWNFVNIPGWVTGNNPGTRAPTTAPSTICGWLVDWKNNVWYRTTQHPVVTWGAALYATKTSSSLKQPAYHPSCGTHASALNYWISLTGRRLGSDRPGARRVRVNDPGRLVQNSGD